MPRRRRITHNTAGIDGEHHALGTQHRPLPHPGHSGASPAVFIQPNVNNAWGWASGQRSRQQRTVPTGHARDVSDRPRRGACTTEPPLLHPANTSYQPDHRTISQQPLSLPRIAHLPTAAATPRQTSTGTSHDRYRPGIVSAASTTPARLEPPGPLKYPYTVVRATPSSPAIWATVWSPAS